MRLTVREWVGVVVGGAGIIAMGLALDDKLDTGTCSSGGPYISTRACPDDALWWTIILVLGTIAWVAGIVSSRSGLKDFGTGQLLWAAGFTALAVLVIVKAATQDSMPADSRLGAYIMGAVFIPVGLGMVLPGLIKRRRGGAAVGDRTATPWQRLLALRSTGAVTGAEFDRIKPELDSAGGSALLTALERLAEEKAAGELTQAEFFERKQQLL